MARRFTVGLLMLAAVAILSQPLSFGQQEKHGGERKVINKVMPVYPELARRTNIRGTVKVGVLVAPNGGIKATTVIGGNPILIVAALDAVRKWKYEPASAQSTELVELKFDSR